MIEYQPPGSRIEDIVNNKDNLEMIMKINNDFFSTCIRELGYKENLKKALDELRAAGEPEIADNINKYMRSEA